MVWIEIDDEVWDLYKRSWALFGVKHACIMFICLYVYITQHIYKLYDYTLLWLYDLTKRSRRRTTIIIDDELWKRFLTYIVKKHGVAKKISVEVEAAIREYLNSHKDQ